MQSTHDALRAERDAAAANEARETEELQQKLEAADKQLADVQSQLATAIQVRAWHFKQTSTSCAWRCTAAQCQVVTMFGVSNSIWVQRV